MIVDEIKAIRTARKDLRNFSFIMAGVLLVVAAVLFLKDRAGFLHFAASGAGFLLIGITAPVILKPLYMLWMGFSIILSWFMSRVLLTLLFYLVLTPIGLILRLFGRRFLDFLDVKDKKSQTGYWNNRKEEERIRNEYERQF
ncbi:MAG: hypothetical protein GY754_19660 [bacterium]|nr:hypothetical protein [bacterium]